MEDTAPSLQHDVSFDAHELDCFTGEHTIDDGHVNDGDQIDFDDNDLATGTDIATDTDIDTDVMTHDDDGNYSTDSLYDDYDHYDDDEYDDGRGSSSASYALLDDSGSIVVMQHNSNHDTDTCQPILAPPRPCSTISRATGRIFRQRVESDEEDDEYIANEVCW
jgi:hypothetical protein